MRHVQRERARPAGVILDALELEMWTDGRTPARRRAVPWYVLTFPFADELRDALHDRKLLGAARRACLELLAAVVLGDNGIEDARQLGILEVTHPEGDRAPSTWAPPDLVRKAETAVTGTYKPHLNFIFPMYAAELERNGDAVRLRRGRRLRWTLTRQALAKLRLGFALIQEAIKGAELGRSAVVYGEFRARPEHKAHAIRYFARGFPAWAADAQQIRWYGLYATRHVAKLPEVIAARELEADRLELERLSTRCCAECGARLRVLEERAAELAEHMRVDYWRILGGPAPPEGSTHDGDPDAENG